MKLYLYNRPRTEVVQLTNSTCKFFFTPGTSDACMHSRGTHTHKHNTNGNVALNGTCPSPIESQQPSLACRNMPLPLLSRLLWRETERSHHNHLNTTN